MSNQPPDKNKNANIRIQQRIDQMRDQGVQQEIKPNGNRPVRVEQNASESVRNNRYEATKEEEDFLESFAQRLKQKPPRQATERIPFTARENAARLSGPETTLSHGNPITTHRTASSIPFSMRENAARISGAEASRSTGNPDTAPKTTAPSAYSRSAPPSQRPAPKMKTLPPEGSILILSTGELIIYDRDVAGQNYQMILHLHHDGRATPEGLNLQIGCEYRAIGTVNLQDVVNMHITQTWYRSHIVFNLNQLEDGKLIPDPGNEAPESIQYKATRDADWPETESIPPPKDDLPAPQEIEGKPNGAAPFGLRIGQRFRIKMGEGRSWSVVYMGGHGPKTLVLHRTHGDWALMHLDLSRFPQSSIVLDDMMSEREIWEMREILKRTYL